MMLAKFSGRSTSTHSSRVTTPATSSGTSVSRTSVIRRNVIHSSRAIARRAKIPASMKARTTVLPASNSETASPVARGSTASTAAANSRKTSVLSGSSLGRTGAPIEDDHRRLVRVDAVFPADVADLQDPEQRIDLQDPEQRIISRPLRSPRVRDHFIFEVQQRRQAGALVLQHVVGAPAQRVPEQDGPLPHIAGVVQEFKHLLESRRYVAREPG